MEIKSHIQKSKMSMKFNQKLSCKKSECKAILYKMGMCKNHMLDFLGAKMRHTMKIMFKNSEEAFAKFNFTGKSNVSIDDIISFNIVINRVGFPKQDIISYLLRDKIFESRNAEITFQIFKKSFFP